MLFSFIFIISLLVLSVFWMDFHVYNNLIMFFHFEDLFLRFPFYYFKEPIWTCEKQLENKIFIQQNFQLFSLAKLWMLYVLKMRV